MKKIQLNLLFLCASAVAVAQENKAVNKGEFSVRPGTLVSSYFDFDNQAGGRVENDGEMHFYGHYNNDGEFLFSQNLETGYVVFEGKMPEKQEITGSAPSYFYNVLFNKEAVDDNAFHLKGEIVNQGTVSMQRGVVLMDKAAGGAFVFLKGANHTMTSDRSHVRGEVEKEGNEAFTYPVGDRGYYRFASISAPANEAHAYTGEYLFENSDAQYPHSSKEDLIKVIDDKEYWVINQNAGTTGSVVVTLSWDSRTTPGDLYANEGKEMRIVRWDKDAKMWKDQGGVVDYASKTISTPAQVNGFGVFTLANLTVPCAVIDADIEVFDAVTPNGDGKNDFFFIKNLENYPQNRVTIVNRWGAKLFYAENYGVNGNVFKGYAQGKGVLNAGEQIPTGTYYYMIEYLKTTNGVSNWHRKTGYLHLETE